jgi:hypothetical protein
MLSTSRTSPWARVKGVGPQPHGHELDLGVVVTRQFGKAAVGEVAAAESQKTSEGLKGDEHAGPPRRPTAFGHDGLFRRLGPGRAPTRAGSVHLHHGAQNVDPQPVVLLDTRPRPNVTSSQRHLGGHSAHPVAPVTPGDELVLMWWNANTVSERVGERPVERLDAIVERHPGSISPRYASSSVPPLIPEKYVVTKTSSGPGSGSATAATRT